MENQLLKKNTTWTVLGLTVLVIAFTACLSYITGTPIDHLTRDPAYIANIPAYTGFMSFVGIIVLSSAASLCLFSAFWIYMQKSDNDWIFLAVSGLVTLYLVADDALQFHENIIPQYAGFSQSWVYGSYLGAALLFVGFFRDYFRRYPAHFFWSAILLLGISIGMDVIFENTATETFIEDSFKLMGYIFWLLFYFHFSIATLEPTLHAPNVEEEQHFLK